MILTLIQKARPVVIIIFTSAVSPHYAKQLSSKNNDRYWRD